MSDLNEQNENLEVVDERQQEIEKRQIPRGGKKNTVELTISCVLFTFALFTSFFLTEFFIANVDLFQRHDLSILVIIITLPIFIILFALNLFLSIPAFVISLMNAISLKFQRAEQIIIFVLCAFELIYPIILLLIIIFFPHSSSSTTSSEMSDSVESAIAFLIH